VGIFFFFFMLFLTFYRNNVFVKRRRYAVDSNVGRTSVLIEGLLKRSYFSRRCNNFGHRIKIYTRYAHASVCTYTYGPATTVRIVYELGETSPFAGARVRRRCLRHINDAVDAFPPPPLFTLNVFMIITRFALLIYLSIWFIFLNLLLYSFLNRY
jgi:hypothetical protein